MKRSARSCEPGVVLLPSKAPLDFSIWRSMMASIF
jgi:hypothetical protein